MRELWLERHEGVTYLCIIQPADNKHDFMKWRQTHLQDDINIPRPDEGTMIPVKLVPVGEAPEYGGSDAQQTPL